MKKLFARRFVRLMCLLAGLGLMCYAALVGLVYYWEVNVPQSLEYDSIIVLGAQVLPTGEPSVQLQWRLDKAQECYEKNPCPIVVTGGQGTNEPRPEGDVMRDVLVRQGVPAAHVISETRAVDTRQNISYSWNILQEQGCEKPLIVTSDYHLPRAMAIARDNGVDPLGAGSPCKPGLKFWLKNHLREALAWVKYWGIKYLHLPL